MLAILSFQLATQLFETAGRFWPFMPYSMYSDTYQAGATIAFHEVKLVEHADQPSKESFSAEDFGINPYKFEGLLRSVANEGGWLWNAGEDGAAIDLAAGVRARGDYDAVEVWRMQYTVGRDGLESREPERILVRKLTLEGSEPE